MSLAKRSIGLVDLRNRGTTADDDGLVVSEGRDRGVPALGGHIGTPSPGLGSPVEDVGLDDPILLRVLVAARDQHPAVSELRVSGAEDVVSREVRALERV